MGIDYYYYYYYYWVVDQLYVYVGWDFSGPYLGELRIDTSKPSYQLSAGAYY